MTFNMLSPEHSDWIRRRPVIQAAIARWRPDRAIHVVLAGDFDDTPDSSIVRFWTGKQSLHGISVAYHDTWAAINPDDAGHTFTPMNAYERAGEMSLELGRRIDYVMVRCACPTIPATRPGLPDEGAGVRAIGRFIKANV
ncbi:endonuclease/exonuclease/phosphatase family protein [Actinoplanes sp. CA-142083]|uniref:endonuclease/exonuclease/phosphatase family protein n=1 Tax=Actinoplanes sp. CA-142083 TaxID=3239903 RepID=UPI003D8AEDBF